MENGKAIAVINLIVEPEELERIMMAENVRLNEILAAADQRIKETGGIKHKDFWELVENQNFFNDK